MNPIKLMELLRLGEDQAVEFKAVCDPKTVGRSACAFLNGHGGYIVCGVADRGEVVGLGATVSLPELEGAMAQGLSPKALVSVESHEIESKRVLVIEVPAGKDMPYAFLDQVYVRESGRTAKAGIDTIKDMVLRRQVEPERWERRFSAADTENDLDAAEVAAVVEAANRNSRMQFHDKDDVQAVLQDLAVAKYGRLTNGGDVLFGSTPQLRHPQVRVRAVCFTTDKTDDTYRDMKSLAGPLVSVLEEAYRFIVRNTPTLAHFRKGELARENEPLYPPDAVREGLVNAFAHRDYADYKGGVAVHVYPRRLEIWNSGSLPEGVTLEGLAKGHISVLRNPDIAHVLYLRGMMEKIGRGSLLILNACRDRGLPEPVWSSGGLGVTLTFHAGGTAGPQLGTSNVSSLSQVCLKSVPSAVAEAVLRAGISAVDLRTLMLAAGQTNRTRFRNAVLKPLIDAGLMAPTVPDKPRSSRQAYRLTAKGRQLLATSEADAKDGA
jgi:ATP-dependent DNA helicase RecG